MKRISSENNTTLIYVLACGLYIVIRCLGELSSTDTLTRFRFPRSAKVHARSFLRQISVTFNKRGDGLGVYVAVRNLIFYKKSFKNKIKANKEAAAFKRDKEVYR